MLAPHSDFKMVNRACMGMAFVDPIYRKIGKQRIFRRATTRGEAAGG
jgi:hypothetical protein